MLLSIDRVLALLAEGKSLEKIAALANCTPADVAGVIEEARKLLSQHEKPIARKKIILKRSHEPAMEGEDDMEGEAKGKESRLFDGAEISAVPMNASLTMYIDGASSGNPGPAGIGIVIYDHDDRQVGKISSRLGIKTNNYAEYSALIRALSLAVYFQADSVRIRTDSELIVKQMNGEYQVRNAQIRKMYERATALVKKIGNVKIEHIPRTQNEKADYLAKKAAQ